MAFTNGVGPGQANQSGTTAAVTLNGCTAGRHLIALLPWASSTVTLTSVTVSGESNMTLGTTRTAAGLPVRHCVAYLANITAGGNKTITATWSGSLSGAAVLWVMEFAGGDTSSFFDVEGTATGTGTNAQASVTTTAANDLIIGLTTANTDESGWTVTSGYTVRAINDTNWWDNGFNNLDVGAAGSKSAGNTISSATFLTTISAFKAAGGGGGGAKKRSLPGLLAARAMSMRF